jgi:hypothetical protein
MQNVSLTKILSYVYESLNTLTQQVMQSATIVAAWRIATHTYRLGQSGPALTSLA